LTDRLIDRPIVLPQLGFLFIVRAPFIQVLPLLTTVFEGPVWRQDEDGDGGCVLRVWLLLLVVAVMVVVMAVAVVAVVGGGGGMRDS
jgi:hypothetical protein